MEYWDIYDKDRHKTGRTMKRNDWILKDGEYHLSVLGVIRRPDGRFLITRRIGTKAWAPLWWEVPGGGVRAGETSGEAVIREIREETSLDVRRVPGHLSYSYHRENPGKGDNYFVDVYRFDMDFGPEDIVLQADESIDWKAASLDEIRQLAAGGVFLHYDSIRTVFEDTDSRQGR